MIPKPTTLPRSPLRTSFALILSLLFALSAQAQGIFSFESLTLRIDQPVPSVVWNGNTHSWSVWITNPDTAAYEQGIWARCIVDNKVVQINSGILSQPIPGGDSVRLDGFYSPNILDFGGIHQHTATWEVYNSANEILFYWDQPIELKFAQGNPAASIGIRGSEPAVSWYSDRAIFHAEVFLFNRDTAGLFFLPVNLLCSIDGQPPFLLLQQVTPPATISPGDSFGVQLPPIYLDHASGGGVTHDIIVWPMRTPFFDPADSANFHISAPSLTANAFQAEQQPASETPVTGGQMQSGSLTAGAAEKDIVPTSLSEVTAPEIPHFHDIIWVSPNPVSGSANLHVNSPGGKTTIKILDFTGKTRYAERLILPAGQQQLPISMPDLPPGAYWIRVTDQIGARTAAIQVVE